MSVPVAAPAATVSMASSAAVVQVGAGFSVTLSVSGLGSGPGDSMSSFDVALDFDPALARLTGFGFNDGATGRNQLDLDEPGKLFPFEGDAVAPAGRLSAFGLSGNTATVLDAAQAAAFDFLRLDFLALAASPQAVFVLDVGASFFGDAGVGFLSPGFGATRLGLVFTQGGGGQLPEPGSLGLVLLATGGLLMVRRRAWRGLAAVGSAFVLAGPVAAAGPGGPAVAQPSAMAARPATVDGRVVEVQGQRLRIQPANGPSQWVMVRQPFDARAVMNKRLRATTRVMGDAVVVESANFD